MLPPGPILILEHEEVDLMLLERAFAALRLSNPVKIVTTVSKVIAYLKGEGEFGDRQQHPRPAMLITSYLSNNFEGKQLLEWLHQNPKCHVVPTVVLTASSNPNQIENAYQLGAHCVVKKLISVQQLDKCIRDIMDFWTGCRRSSEYNFASTAVKPKTAPRVLPVSCD
jgi:DNA-binding NarL/FixJ family response regulator